MSLASITYGVSIATVVLFGLIALTLSHRRHKHHQDTTEFFLTARKSVPERTIAWSFFASGVGAWVIFSMPAYVVSAGIVGLVAYSVSSGIPMFLVARVGSVLHRKYPNVMSLGDFVQWRFGTIPMIVVTLIMLLNMFVALTAEYTAIGNLMENVIGAPRLPYIIIVAVVTSVYTAAGGLYVSILTDVAQGVFAVILLLIMTIYVAVTFRPASLPTPLPETLGPNYYGWAACGAMPISLTCATIFSEGPWQRIWASADDRALKRGSLWGSLGLIIVCFMYGFGGFLALWAGYPTSDPYGSTAFFDLLAAGNEHAPTWILVLVSIAAVTMNEGAVDTLQNGIVDTIATRFFRKRSIWYPRVLVFLINIPIVFVSLKGYNIISLFLIGNLVCTICATPVLLGLVTRLEGIVTGISMLFGIVTGFFSIVVFGYIKMGNLKDGMEYTFTVSYDWPSFVLPLVFSTVGTLLAAYVESLIRKACGFAYPAPMNFPPVVFSEQGEEGSVSSGTLRDVEFAADKKFAERR
ncbi:hypothetical protein BGZ81_000325 [Podila clonocystis]|nr:hypothetical protein BGZ81_000325 [Podila clonocystis]